MPEDVFVDTSAWVALADRGEDTHTLAEEAYRDLLLQCWLVTTNLVVAEIFILLRRHLGVAAGLRFMAAVGTSPRIHLVRSSEGLEQEAENILYKYRNHELSFTDAVSFASMKTCGVRRAFSFDRHFIVVGFSVVPAPV